MTDPTETLSAVCELLSEDRTTEAATTLQEQYPFAAR